MAYREPRYETLLQTYFGTSLSSNLVQLEYPR